MRSSWLVLLAACTGAPPPPAIPPDPLPAPLPADAGVAASYTLTFTGSHAQMFEVEAIFPATADRLELMMAGWTPGSYRIRDYAMHVEQVRASTPEGGALPLRKTAVNRWEIDSAGAGDVVVHYQVYADGTTVRENSVEPDGAVLNGAPTFLAAVDRLDQPHDVRFRVPERWPDLATALPAHPSGEPRRYRAPDYDVLVDSPVLLGQLSTYAFAIDGVAHRLVHQHEPAGFDGARAAADVERLSREIVSFWGGMPYREYAFLNVFNGRRGGLEHKASTLMFARSDVQLDDDTYKRWLGLASHEFFHTWNVKRLRPIELGPFDYESPVLTRSLWVSEGLTTYYADLLLARAGLLSEAEWLRRIGDRIGRTERMEGRRIRSLEQASEDAWIKYYQPDANHDNTSTDYYAKGAVVGFLLDARIRRDSRGWASLDDAMRLAASRFSGAAGFTPEAFQEVCEEVAGGSLEDFFSAYVRGTEELDYAPALSQLGLRFVAPSADPKAKPDLGMTLQGGRVTAVRRDGPAWSADLLLGDEVLAIDGRRVRDLASALTGVEPGAEVEVTLSRRDRLRTVKLRVAQADARTFNLEPEPTASIEARSNRARLLGLPRPGSPEARALARTTPEPAAETEPDEP